jgi:hypothetical protein
VPIKQAEADLFENAVLKPSKKLLLPFHDLRLEEINGRPLAVNNKLRIEIGNMNPINAKRHPFRLAMKLMAGAPIKYEIDIPAIIHPITIDLFSRGKKSATNVNDMGVIIALARPDME